MSDDSFLSRWSRRKALTRQGALPPPEPPPETAPAAALREPLPAAPAAAPPDEGAQPPQPPPPPTLDDVAQLTPGADVRRFMAPGVDSPVKNAALKKLFADPHFNVMDGLDTYIDDYGKPDPLPVQLLRRMAGARALGLLDDEPAQAAPDAEPTTAVPLSAADEAPRHEDADLRLQPHHAADAGDAGADEPGAGEDPARQR